MGGKGKKVKDDGGEGMVALKEEGTRESKADRGPKQKTDKALSAFW